MTPESAVVLRHASFVIRPATAEDEGGMTALRGVAGWSTTTVPQQFRAMASGQRLIWVATDQSALRTHYSPLVVPPVIGTITLEWELSDPELADGRTTAHISNLLVHPSHRRVGIGRALTEAAEREAAQGGRSVITIGVDEPNPYARRLYERWGYRWFKDSTAAWGRIHMLRRTLQREYSVLSAEY